MALERFRAPALPIPNAEYDQRTMTDIIRALRLYFNQLDSLTPNQAQSYRADNFYGGEFDGTVMTANNVATSTLTATYSNVSSMMSEFIRSKGFLGGNFVGGTFMGTEFYGGTFNGSGSGFTMPYGAFYQNGSTELTANITNVSTTPIQVTSTADFQSAGLILIADELIQYTGKTATTFTGITRGVKGTTNVAHTAGVAITEAAGVTAGSSASMVIDTVTASNGVTCTVPDSKVYFTNAGFYNIQFGVQLLNFTASEDNVTIWLRKNGSDVPYSAGVQQVNAKHGTTPGSQITAWNYVDQFAAGDYFEFYWTSDTGNTVLATFPAGTTPVHPVSPSLILTVTFVSAISAGTGSAAYKKVAPISVTGFGQIGTVIVNTTNTI